MALANTTLGAAAAINDTDITVASATSVASGRLVKVDHEVMEVTKEYSSGVIVPVLRGRNGTAQVAHLSASLVVHGLPSDFDAPMAQTGVIYGTPVVRDKVSYAAAGAITLPAAGRDLDVELLGTDVLAMTLAVPTLEQEGSRINVYGSGAAAHTLTVASGVGGAGSNYDVFTWNGTGTVELQLIARNLLWVCPQQVTGTLTNTATAMT